MNELSEIFLTAEDGDEIILKNRIYEVYPENVFHLTGLFFSNTARINENPDGERFCAIYLNGKKNITIDGRGASVLLHGIMTPFIFVECENIVMKNISFDRARPTMSELTFISSSEGRATVRINDDFLYRIDGNMLYWRGENGSDGRPYWEIPYKGEGVLTNAFTPETQVIDDMRCGEDDSGHGFPDISEIRETEKGVLELKFREEKRIVPEGTVAQTRSIRRVQTGGAIDRCRGVTLSGLKIFTMNCFGILSQNSRDITLDRIVCVPKDGRTIVSDADFFHFSGCSGEVRVTNCVAGGAHDDIINIHGTHLRIISVDKEKSTVLVRYCHRESWGFEAYAPGDKIEYVNGDTLLAYGEATVISSEKVSPSDILVTVDRLPGKIPGENDVIENVTRTASLTVENNVFYNIPSRGILCTTRKDVVIRNNVFRNMGAAALCVADDANFWFESGRSGDIYFENNTVEYCAARPDAFGDALIRYEPVVLDKASVTPVHGRLFCRGNRFILRSGRRALIELNYLSEAVIEDNTCNGALDVTAHATCRLTAVNQV